MSENMSGVQVVLSNSIWMDWFEECSHLNNNKNGVYDHCTFLKGFIDYKTLSFV